MQRTNGKSHNYLEQLKELFSFRCWQWHVGSFLITASWLNLLTYFRSVPFFGIYILMFYDIFNTATRFSVILLVFIVAFGLGFHLIFINQVSKFKENEEL